MLGEGISDREIAPGLIIWNLSAGCDFKCLCDHQQGQFADRR
jgi:hypothetical protein